MLLLGRSVCSSPGAAAGWAWRGQPPSFVYRVLPPARPANAGTPTKAPVASRPSRGEWGIPWGVPVESRRMKRGLHSARDEAGGALVGLLRPRPDRAREARPLVRISALGATGAPAGEGSWKRRRRHGRGVLPVESAEQMRAARRAVGKGHGGSPVRRPAIVLPCAPARAVSAPLVVPDVPFDQEAAFTGSASSASVRPAVADLSSGPRPRVRASCQLPGSAGSGEVRCLAWAPRRSPLGARAVSLRPRARLL